MLSGLHCICLVKLSHVLGQIVQVPRCVIFLEQDKGWLLVRGNIGWALGEFRVKKPMTWKTGVLGRLLCLQHKLRT